MINGKSSEMKASVDPGVDPEPQSDQAWEKTKEFIEANIVADSSMKKYSSQMREYEAWWAKNGRLAADDSSFSMFLIDKSRNSGVTYSKSHLGSYSKSVSHHYRFEDESCNPTKSKWAVAARTVALKFGRYAVSKNELEEEHLNEGLMQMEKRLRLAEASSNNAEAFHVNRNGLMILLSSRTLLRGEEAANLRVEEVFLERFGSDDFIFILVAESKTDRQHEIPIEDRNSGKVLILCVNPNKTICPIEWFRRYTELKASVPSKVIKKLGGNWRPFFCQINGEPLSKETLRHRVKDLVISIGLDPSKYGGHSTRSGAATTLIRKGVDLLLVKRLGRWKSGAVFLYIRHNATDMLKAHLQGFSATEPNERDGNLANSLETRETTRALDELTRKIKARELAPSVGKPPGKIDSAHSRQTAKVESVPSGATPATAQAGKLTVVESQWQKAQIAQAAAVLTHLAKLSGPIANGTHAYPRQPSEVVRTTLKSKKTSGISEICAWGRRPETNHQ